MLLPATSRLDERLVRSLASEPGLRAKDLRSRAASAGRRFTLQGVYGELKKLQEQNVVVKVKDRYYLSLTWASELLALGDTVYDSYFQAPSSAQFLPPPGKSLHWRFSNLIRADDFYVQLTLAVCRAGNHSTVFEWVPHPWFYLVPGGKEVSFQSALRAAGIKVVCIIGGRTAADDAYRKSALSPLNVYSSAPSPFASLKTDYFQVIGDYIVTLRVAPQMSREIETIFSSTKSLRGFSYRDAFNKLSVRSKTTVTIEHRSARARKIEKIFGRFFGPP